MEDTTLAYGMSQQYDPDFEMLLQTISPWKETSNPVSEQFLNGANVDRIASFSTLILYFRLLVEDICKIMFQAVQPTKGKPVIQNIYVYSTFYLIRFHLRTSSRKKPQHCVHMVN